MTGPRATHVVVGDVLVEAGPTGLTTAQAVGIAEGRVLAVGDRRTVLDAAAPGARVTDASGLAVVPGMHDFHLHLVGMARARRALRLDDVKSFDELVRRVEEAVRARRGESGAWLTGRGWHEQAMNPSALDRLEAALDGRPAALTSHDGHSLWASRAALATAGIGPSSTDPSGGRLERDAAGAPNGILREAAMSTIDAVKERLAGDALRPALRETLTELAALGITGVTDAGDADDRGGRGELADLGDSFSTIAELGAEVDGRLRLTVNMPAAAIDAAASRGLPSGGLLGGTRRVGWAKLYSDGALGSRTAALFAPHTCGDGGDAGILRYEPAELREIVTRAGAAGIAMAVHAIGDRAVATALDALEATPAPGVAHRIEHAQLVRPADRARFAAAGIVASLQPIHAAADRDAVEACWADRQEHAYTWRSLAAAGARLAFGSDAPIESVNPWHGLFAAVRRHAPGDGRPPWHLSESVTAGEALTAYTLAPAAALGRPDEGSLRPGAVADLAVLDVSLSTLLEADEPAAGARSQLTLVGGREVPLA
jgi:predicted amidohydrolase YtcJ